MHGRGRPSRGWEYKHATRQDLMYTQLGTQINEPKGRNLEVLRLLLHFWRRFFELKSNLLNEAPVGTKPLSHSQGLEFKVQLVQLGTRDVQNRGSNPRETCGYPHPKSARLHRGRTLQEL
jgi:hypothetical protein